MPSLFDFTDDTDWFYDPSDIEFTGGGMRVTSGFDDEDHGLAIAISPRITAPIADIRELAITMTERVGYEHYVALIIDGPAFSFSPYEYIYALTGEGLTAFQLSGQSAYAERSLARFAQWKLWPDIATFQVCFLLSRAPGATRGIISGFEFMTGSQSLSLPGEPGDPPIGPVTLAPNAEEGLTFIPDFPYEPTYISPIENFEFWGGYRQTIKRATRARRVIRNATWAARSEAEALNIKAAFLAFRRYSFSWTPVGDLVPSKWVALDPTEDREYPAPFAVRATLVEVFP